MMAGTPNADHKGTMECAMPQCTASQPTLPITNFNPSGGIQKQYWHNVVECLKCVCDICCVCYHVKSLGQLLLGYFSSTYLEVAPTLFV